MTFKPAIWYPIAVVLSVINLVGVGFAAGSAEPWHVTVHAALALAFGLWAQRLRPGPSGSELPARLEALEAEVSDLGRSFVRRRSASTSPNGCWRRDGNRAEWARSARVRSNPT